MWNMASAHHVLFYDGECGLCDRFVQRVLDADKSDRFRLAPLQGSYAKHVLAERGVVFEPGEQQTVYVLTRDGELLDRSDAVLFTLSELGLTGWWRAAKIFPRPLRELGYRAVARTRFGIFGKADACRVPGPGVADKFIRDSSG
jgi:predicted DCC family thiol-disulfide oxidoreductase YuxK